MKCFGFAVFLRTAFCNGPPHSTRLLHTQTAQISTHVTLLQLPLPLLPPLPTVRGIEGKAVVRRAVFGRARPSWPVAGPAGQACPPPRIELPLPTIRLIREHAVFSCWVVRVSAFARQPIQAAAEGPQGKGTVLAAKTVETQCKIIVLATKTVEHTRQRRVSSPQRRCKRKAKAVS